MPIAFSEGKLLYQLLRADTVPHLLADIDAVMLDIGIPRAVITGGFKYTLQSPQGFEAKLFVQDLGDVEPLSPFKRLTLTVKSSDETLAGYVHKLSTGGATYLVTPYEMIANTCQVWIALQGYSDEVLNGFIGSDVDPQRYAFQCGIPYVGMPTDAPCLDSQGADVTTDVWWSSSKEHIAPNLLHLRSSRYAMYYFSHCYNGVLYTNDGSGVASIPATGALQFYTVTMTEDIDFFWFSHPKTLKYFTDDPLQLHPFIGWDFAIRGIVYDAFLVSTDQPLDNILTTTEVDVLGNSRVCTWLAWNRSIQNFGGGGVGTWFATLYLLIDRGDIVEGSNYVY